jgi:hypothetical protein
MDIPVETINTVIDVVGGALLALIGSGVIYWIKSRRGNKVILEKVNETSVIQLSEKVRDNLSITYKGNKVNQLILYEFNLYNNGDNNISDFNMTVHFLNFDVNSPFFIEPIINDIQDETTTDLRFTNDGNHFELRINRPYLNAKKKFNKELITIQILADTNMGFNVIGGGEGWGTEYLDITKPNKILLALSNSLLLIASIIIGIAVFSKNNVYDSLLIAIGIIVMISSSFYPRFVELRKSARGVHTNNAKQNK